MNDNETEYQLLEVNNPHDKICRKALDKKKDAVKIINRILKDGEKISENEIEKYTSSYISDELRNSESDVVYKLKNENVFFLIEHQTKIDYSMPYRILKYELNVIDSVSIDNKYIGKEYKYSLVIPIVLYTGKEKWDAKLDLRSMQYKWSKYLGQELSRYNILDINEISDSELLEEKSIISKIMLIEKSKTEEELCKNLSKIYSEINNNKAIYTKEEKKFLNKATGVLALNILGEKKAKEILNNINVGGDGDMLAVFDMIREEKLKDINIGRKEGRLQAKIEDIKNMLKEKLPIDLISRITGVSEEEIEKYTKLK